MTPQERFTLWLGLVKDAHENARVWRRAAREWPSEPSYSENATKAYRRALLYLRNARRFKDMLTEESQEQSRAA